MHVAGDPAALVFLRRHDLSQQADALFFRPLPLHDLAAQRFIRFRQFGGSLDNLCFELFLRKF